MVGMVVAIRTVVGLAAFDLDRNPRLWASPRLTVASVAVPVVVLGVAVPPCTCAVFLLRASPRFTVASVVEGVTSPASVDVESDTTIFAYLSNSVPASMHAKRQSALLTPGSNSCIVLVVVALATGPV